MKYAVEFDGDDPKDLEAIRDLTNGITGRLRSAMANFAGVLRGARKYNSIGGQDVTAMSGPEVADKLEAAFYASALVEDLDGSDWDGYQTAAL